MFFLNSLLTGNIDIGPERRCCGRVDHFVAFVVGLFPDSDGKNEAQDGHQDTKTTPQQGTETRVGNNRLGPLKISGLSDAQFKVE